MGTTTLFLHVGITLNKQRLNFLTFRSWFGPFGGDNAAEIKNQTDQSWQINLEVLQLSLDFESCLNTQSLLTK